MRKKGNLERLPVRCIPLAFVSIRISKIQEKSFNHKVHIAVLAVATAEVAVVKKKLVF